MVAAAGVATKGQALIHLLLRASLLGHIVRGPMVDGIQAYVLVRDWLGERPDVDREAALDKLAQRYLAGHGPATDRDLARWSGLPLGAVRQGLASIQPATDANGDGFPPPRLMGPFEPVLMGWTSRVPILGEHDQSLVTTNGIFRPFGLVNGRAVATWRLARNAVEIRPLTTLDPSDEAALEADADAVLQFLA